MLEQHFPDLGAGGMSGTIVFRADQGVDDPAVTATMEEFFALVEAGFPDGSGVPEHPGATVISPYSEEGQDQIARQGPLAGELAYARVNLAADVALTESGLLGQAIHEHAPDLEGLEVLPGGMALAEGTLPATELIGLAFAVVVLIVAFGSVLAMGLPVAVAVGGVGAGSALILLLSHLFMVPDFTVTVGAMIGLGVGIDYALFIVTRFRRGTHDGLTPRAALVAAMDTAGRAVILAGLTVVISLLGMLLIGIALVSGLGVGASVTVLATMVTSVTLLPALLGLAGERVEVTRWRGLITAGFVAVALFGAGAGVAPLAAGGAVLAALTLLASFAVRPLRQRGAPAGRQAGAGDPRLPLEPHDPAASVAVARWRGDRTARPGVPGPRPPAGRGRREHLPRGQLHPAGLRPAGRGVRRGVQRASPAHRGRRPGRHARGGRRPGAGTGPDAGGRRRHPGGARPAGGARRRSS